MTPVVVLKFGGWALATPERIVRSADRIARWRAAGHAPVVVASASGRTTDRILRWLRRVRDSEAAPDREADRALATGESLAAGLLAAALVARGLPAVSLGAAEAGLSGSGPHGRGRITHVDPGPLERLLSAGRIPIVAGFQVIGPDGELLTLERGGSDITAVHLAAALRAEACHLIKDVSGVHDRDPKVDAGARLLASVHPAEVRRLALGGAGVLHPDAARAAESAAVVLRIYGFDDPVFGAHGSTVSLAGAERGSNPLEAS